MASVVRGLSRQGPGTFFEQPLMFRLSQNPRCRAFTTSPFRFMAARRSASNPQKNTPSLSNSNGATTTMPTRPAGPSRYAFIKSLGNKPTPTILYEGPSHFWFYFGCWSGGISILGWVALTGPSFVFQPQEVGDWVGWTYGVAYVMFAAMGFYLISKTPNLVGRIRLLPIKPAPRPAPASSSASTARATAPPLPAPATAIAPQLEVTVNRAVPLLAPKVVTASLDNVVLKSRLSLPEEYVPELKRLERQREEVERQRELLKFDKQHLLTAPFRGLWRALSGLFNGVKAAWTDIGFGVIKVDGKSYKVDVTKGFAHDGFRTLERIVKIDP